MVNCPNCGSDVGESKFCPNCGTKIEMEKPKSFCPNCGSDVGESKFCPNCGTKISTGSDDGIEQSDFVDNLINKSDNLSGRISSRLKKSKAVDAIFDKTASLGYKQIDKVDSSANRKLFEKTEPVFLEVFDSIEDNFIKAILLFEREKRNTVDGYGIIGAVATTVNTPTRGMSHDEAIQFYCDIVDDIKSEIAKEKQMGIFDEETFYKKKQKESSLSKLSF